MDFMQKSIEIIKKNQGDSGAFIACPNFETYHYSWFRDGAYIAYALGVSGEHESARKFHIWCAGVLNRYCGIAKNVVKRLGDGKSLKENEFLPTRFTMDGVAVDDEWTNFQTDGFGTWLWALGEYIKLSGDKALISEIKEEVETCIEYLIAVWNAPCYDCWEEHLNYIHTYTLGSIYTGLQSAAGYTPEYAQIIKTTLVEIKQYIKQYLIKDDQLIKMVGMDGVETKCTTGVDASLIGMFVPYNIFEVNSDVAKKTIVRIEQDIHRTNGGVYRYLQDTYFGGGEWILLSCWLGWYYVQAGQKNKAEEILRWVEQHFSQSGELPEMVLDHVFDKEKQVEWENRWGKNAQPLLWSHAMYLIIRNAIR